MYQLKSMQKALIRVGIAIGRAFSRLTPTVPASISLRVVTGISFGGYYPQFPFLASRPASAYHNGCVLEPLRLIFFS